jgi:hypothetical protein
VCTLYEKELVERPVDDDCIETEDCEIFEVVKTEQTRICFPDRVDCTSDEQCPQDMVCTDFSILDEFHDRALNEMLYGPLQWQNPDDIAIVACLPKGLIAVFNDHGDIVPDGEMQEWFTGGEDAGVSAGASSGQSLDETSETDEEINEETSEESLDGGTEDDSDAGVSKSSKKDDKGDNGGCSVTQVGSTSASGSLLFGVFLLMFVIRRYCF